MSWGLVSQNSYLSPAEHELGAVSQNSYLSPVEHGVGGCIPCQTRCQTPSSHPGIPPASSDPLGRAGDVGTPTNTSTLVCLYILFTPCQS